MVKNFGVETDAGEIEVGVVSEVDDCGMVGSRGFVFDGQLRGRGDSVNNIDGQSARITFIAVGGNMGETDGSGGLRDNGDGPKFLVKAQEAAMEVVRTVIDSELVGCTVEGKFALADAL